MTARVLLVALGVILPLVGGELVLRLAGHRIILYDGEIYVPDPDPDLGYSLRPFYVSDNWGGAPVRLNSSGLRDAERSRRKAPGTCRVVALGDSFTFGSGVTLEESYVRVLERMLAADRVEVLNFGIPGYNTPQEVALFKHLALAYQPDLVLLGYVLNDHLAEMSLDSDESTPAPSWLKGLLRRSHVLHFVFRRIRPVLHRGRQVREIDSGEEVYARFDAQPGWPRTVKALAELGGMADRRGIPVVVVVFPFVQLLSDYPFERYHREVCRVSRAAGFLCLDLLESMRTSRPGSLLLSRDDPHPNAWAYARAAEAIARFLRSADLHTSCADRLGAKTSGATLAGRGVSG